ncbi:hypothetical protein [Lactiplantibacillus brownii]|uniref:hypothetical protein n=1 Tax=Lactiplantibacillus brownii TaxID=3069269 RepID=UPI0038B27768
MYVFLNPPESHSKAYYREVFPVDHDCAPIFAQYVVPAKRRYNSQTSGYQQSRYDSANEFDAENIDQNFELKPWTLTTCLFPPYIQA